LSAGWGTAIGRLLCHSLVRCYLYWAFARRSILCSAACWYHNYLHRNRAMHW